MPNIKSFLFLVSSLWEFIKMIFLNSKQCYFCSFANFAKNIKNKNFCLNITLISVGKEYGPPL